MNLFSPGCLLIICDHGDRRIVAMPIHAYPVLADGSFGKKKLFFDGITVPKLRYKEVPDGIKVDQQGNCWMAGPGGLLIISPTGKLLGRIDTGEVISNCAWDDDGSTRYLASSLFLCRIKELYLDSQDV